MQDRFELPEPGGDAPLIVLLMRRLVQKEIDALELPSGPPPEIPPALIADGSMSLHDLAPELFASSATGRRYLARRDKLGPLERRLHDGDQRVGERLYAAGEELQRAIKARDQALHELAAMFSAGDGGWTAEQTLDFVDKTAAAVDHLKKVTENLRAQVGDIAKAIEAATTDVPPLERYVSEITS